MRRHHRAHHRRGAAAAPRIYRSSTWRCSSCSPSSWSGYRYRRGPAILASLLSIAAFDFGFVPPYYTFDVHDPAYYLTFGVMLARGAEHGPAHRPVFGSRPRMPVSASADARALYALSSGAVRRRGSLQDQLGDRDPAHRGSGPRRGPGVPATDRCRTPAAEDWPADRTLRECGRAGWRRPGPTENGESAGWGTRHCAEAEALVVPLEELPPDSRRGHPSARVHRRHSAGAGAGDRARRSPSRRRSRSSARILSQATSRPGWKSSPSGSVPPC